MDSITEWCDSVWNKRYTDKLAEKLQKNKIYPIIAVVNAGIGDKTLYNEGVERFESDILEAKGG